MKIGNLNISKVSRAHMLKVAPDILGVSVSGMSTEQLVKALADNFKKLKKEDILDCDDCGGSSDVELEACPFCGSADENDDAAKGKAAAVAKTDEPPARKMVGEPTPIKVIDKPKDAKEGKALAVVPAAPAAAVPVVIDKGEVALDNAVGHIKNLKSRAAVSIWEIGEYVFKNVFESKLWTQRKTTDGKTAHKSFTHWVKGELGLGDAFVYQAMEISRTFSRDQAAQMGTTHLRYLVGAPKEDRQELFDKVKAEGLQIKAVKGLVDSARKKKGVKVQSNIGKDMPKGGRVAANVALIFPNGRFHIPLIAKGTEDKPVKRFADKPTLRLEGKNGVTLVLSLTENMRGEWVATGTPKRTEG